MDFKAKIEELKQTFGAGDMILFCESANTGVELFVQRLLIKARAAEVK